MPQFWLPISDVTAEGREFEYSDQAQWSDWLVAHGLSGAKTESLVARINVLPQGDKAALIRGSMSGEIVLDCDRCTKSYKFPLAIDFDLYEELDPAEDNGDGVEARIREEDGCLQINVGELLWDEFALALPVKPLCDDGCKGLCPGCGVDLNKGECCCQEEEGDPRLAVFRDLKIK